MPYGRMNWQKHREYGKRNYSELAIQRYKKILVINYMHVILKDKSKRQLLAAVF